MDRNSRKIYYISGLDGTKFIGLFSNIINAKVWMFVTVRTKAYDVVCDLIIIRPMKRSKVQNHRYNHGKQLVYEIP